jgi:Thioesterase-like superfamily
VDAFFTADGGSYMPGTMTRGPWGATMGGQIVGGLLGWALDRQGGDDLQPARLTVDLLRPVPIEPVSIEMSIQRDGRRIKLVDAAMSQQGRVVARASALFLRRSAQPEGQVWSGTVAIPPVPVDAEPLESEVPFGIWTYSANSDDGTPGMPPPEWEQPGVQKFAWTRIFRPMAAGHPLTPFARAAFAGDTISSLTHGAQQDCATSTRITPWRSAGYPKGSTSVWPRRPTTATTVWERARQRCSTAPAQSVPGLH